tara:strand:- start:493 stop:744 length:252 start_codon:yes stop_codon:yes gene_type:complete
MKLLYFAWVRERIGHGEEEITLPDKVKNVKNLIDWLIDQNPKYKSALSDCRLLRVAINMEFSSFDEKVCNDDEVAFFPPVTGG